MFAWKTTTWETAKEGENALPKLDTHTSGMVAGTKVATRVGWTAIETLTEGEQVLTFDGGFQTVIAITRHVLMTTDDTEAWPLAIPAGTLGNRESLTLLPHQSIMIESDAADDLLDDPFAVIPANALDGFRGISRMRPDAWIEVIQLHFAQDEIVFANIGALFLCRAKSDLLSDAAPTSYDVLSMDVARDLVDCLEIETQPQAPAFAATYAQHAA